MENKEKNAEATTRSKAATHNKLFSIKNAIKAFELEFDELIHEAQEQIIDCANEKGAFTQMDEAIRKVQQLKGEKYRKIKVLQDMLKENE